METKITLESIDKKIDLLYSVHGALDKKVEIYRKTTVDRFDSIDQKFAEVDRRFDEVDKHFDLVDARFDAMDRRFDSLEGNMNEKFNALENRFDEVIAFLKKAAITVRENPFSGLLDIG